MKKILMFLAALFFVGQLALAQQIPFDQFIHLKEGMTEAEVLSRFGQPTQVVEDEAQTRGTVRSGQVRLQTNVIKRYYYIGNKQAGEKTTIIHFRGGKVIKYERI